MNARVPVIKAFNIEFGLEVDITFSRGFGVANSRVFQHFFEIQPEAAKLCLFTRNWLDYNGLNFRNFVIVLLVVFFLQRHGYLPSIDQVTRGNRRKTFVDGKFTEMKNCFKDSLILPSISGVQVQFDKRKGVYEYGLKTIDSFSLLVRELFNFYASINFSDALCTRTGKFRSRPQM
jgi:DNA polymerase sigma